MIATQDETVYLQLAQKLELGGRSSKVIPRILATLLDETEARLVLAAAPPATVEELSRKTGIDIIKIEAMVGPLFRKGVLFKSRKPDGVRYYRVRQILQLHDSTAVMDDPPPGMLDLWKEYMRTEWEEQTRVFRSRGQPFIRVVPINVSIEANSQILASDDARNLIAQARNIAVTKCSCRAIDGACGLPVEVCIQLDRSADYALERGTGRKLTRDEALRMLEMCEEEGLVHVTGNKQGLSHVICNCCRDCCMNWPSLKNGTPKSISPSRFRALVDASACNGCEDCIDRCFFGALRMEGALAAVDEEKCMGCGICRPACMLDAIKMEVVRPLDFVPA